LVLKEIKNIKLHLHKMFNRLAFSQIVKAIEKSGWLTQIRSNIINRKNYVLLEKIKFLGL